jgi:UDP-N-acetylglucosamine 1-carboxyvinyltransferase
MAHLVIEGGRRLNGRISVEGNKNAALPILAACLLTAETCEIRNVPHIRDVAVMVDLLRSLGAEIEQTDGTTWRVTCRDIHGAEPDASLVGRLRGSVLLLGALLGRVGRANLRRQAAISRATDHYDAPARAGRARRAHRRRRRRPSARGADGLKGASLYLVESVRHGHRDGACWPPRWRADARRFGTRPASRTSSSCASFLAAMGADVRGAGTSTISIVSTGPLRGAVHTLRGDYIEAGSWAVVGAVTGGELEVSAPSRRIWSRSPPSSRRWAWTSARSPGADRAPVRARRRAPDYHRVCGPGFRATS